PPPGGVPLSFRQTERSWFVPAGAIVAVALVLILVGVLFSRTDAGHNLFHRSTATTVPAQRGPIALAGLTAFDPPPGDGNEHQELATDAHDGDANTGWHTATYTRTDLGGLKPGVGLIIQAQGRHRFSRLEVDSPTRGWSASVYIAPSPASTLAGWGKPVASRSNIDGS